MTAKSHSDSIDAPIGTMLNRELRRTALWAEQLAHARSQPSRLESFSERCAEWLGQAGELNVLTDGLRERYTAEPAAPEQIEMTLAPFSPPLRQISAVRQGAPEWSASTPASEPQLIYTPVTLEHAVSWLPRAPMDSILGDALVPGQSIRSMQHAGASIRRARRSPMKTDE